MSARYEILKGKGGYRFNLIAPNGRIILSSETYTSKAGARNGIGSVKKNAKTKSRYEVREARNGEEYFVLKARNGEPIGRSETYESPSGTATGMASVQQNARGARIDDET